VTYLFLIIEYIELISIFNKQIPNSILKRMLYCYSNDKIVNLNITYISILLPLFNLGQYISLASFCLSLNFKNQNMKTKKISLFHDHYKKFLFSFLKVFV